ncbi:MAG TPA: cytochrome c oxidase assembly protein [Chloroflexota bacterium]|jgi:cytochrome c oxidase assembly factor CtaG
MINAWAEVQLDPLLVVPLVGIGVAYAIGYRRFVRRTRPDSAVPARATLFILGYTALLVALLSPLHSVGEQFFSVHMVQHLLLTLVAAPLLLLSNSMPVLLWALPRRDRATVGRLFGQPGPVRAALVWLTQPVIAGSVFVVTQWAWHQPVLYELALESRWAHYLEHIVFFSTAVLFWWPVIGAAPLRTPLGYPARMAYTFLGWMPNTLLGAGISLSRDPLYPTYINAAHTYGVDAAADQQLAGLIMWVPGDILFAMILMVLLAAYMRHEEREAERIDRELDARDAAALAAKTSASTAAYRPPSR